MNVLTILKDFTYRCESIFENTTTSMHVCPLKIVDGLYKFNN